MLPLKQSTAITVPFFVHDVNGDAVTGLSDGSFTKRISKNGAAFGAMTVTITEMENGWYSIPLSTSHSDTLGILTIVFTNAGAKQVNLQWRVHARLPDDLAWPTTTGRSIDVTAGGAVGIDWGNVENQATAVDLSATDIQLCDTVTTLTGHTAQTGDSFALQPITHSGTANAGDSTIKITLTGGVATDNYYNGQTVIITGGAGVGQSRTILSYLAAGTAATPTRDFAVAPDGTSTFIVVGNDVAALLEAGVAQAGGAATITLDASASAINSTYVNNFVMITGGTGIGQTRLIGAYNGTTKVATVVPNWTTAPDATSIYQVLPMARVDVGGWLGNLVTGDGDWAQLQSDATATLANTAEIGTAGAGLTAIPWNAAWDTEVQSEANDALVAFFTSSAQLVDDIWNEPTIGHTTAGTFGEQVKTDIDNILDDSNELQTDWVNGGRLDLILDSILDDTDLIDDATSGLAKIAADAAAILLDTGTDGVAIGIGAIGSSQIAADAIGASELAADAATEIADAVFKRDMDQVEATAAKHSLCSAVLKAVSKVENDAGTMKTYRTNGTTLHLSQTIGTDVANDPIDSLTVGV
jgi:hypothetical protein